MQRKQLIDEHERGEAEQRQLLHGEQKRAEIKLANALEKRKQKSLRGKQGEPYPGLLPALAATSLSQRTTPVKRALLLGAIESEATCSGTDLKLPEKARFPWRLLLFAFLSMCAGLVASLLPATPRTLPLIC
jgi:hypothetical protein